MKRRCKHCVIEVAKIGNSWEHINRIDECLFTLVDVHPGYHKAEPYVPEEPLPPAAPPDNRLWIFMHQTGAWECHKSTNREMRDYLRQVWRSAGHPTAVCK